MEAGALLGGPDPAQGTSLLGLGMVSSSAQEWGVTWCESDQIEIGTKLLNISLG